MKLSVSITTYNQGKYIAQAIESALAQKTDFDYEILIGEDDSSDGTRDIVRGYSDRFPEKIRLFLNDRKNVICINGQPTARWNLINNLKNARGNYIALLEGDDYWTDPCKLQKQVGLLDAHPEYVSCFHPVDWLVQKTGKVARAGFGPPFIADGYTTDDLLRHSNFIPTCSVVFRKHLLEPLPSWFLEIPLGDFPLHVMLSTKGQIGFINESMAVYRRHEESMHGGQTLVFNRERLIATYEQLGEIFNFRKRGSYTRKTAALYVELASIYEKEGSHGRSLRALKKALNLHYKTGLLAKYLLKWIASAFYTNQEAPGP